MTVTIELRPDIEASLALLAEQQGLSLPQYVRKLLEVQTPAHGALSAAARAAAWRESAKNLPYSPPLTDTAISRDSIYDSRG